MNTTRLLLVVATFLVAVMLMPLVRQNRQSRCVFVDMLQDKEIDQTCLAEGSADHAYFNTIVAHQTGMLCEVEPCSIVRSAETQHIMQNYYSLLSQPDSIESTPPNTLPSSLYLWAQSRQLLKQNQSELAAQHRNLAIRADDGWLYAWQPAAAWAEYARELYARGDFAQSLHAYQTSLVQTDQIGDAYRDGFQATAWAGIAQAAYAQGDVALAHDAIETAYQLNPTNEAIRKLYQQIMEA